MPCYRPFTTKQGQPAPCGKCEYCRKRRASGWSFRILKEAESFDSAFFLTLTYDSQYLPWGYEYEIKKGVFACQLTHRPTVDTRHLQKFIKRIRKLHEVKINKKRLNARIKYYAVSEYGETSWRPHYHILIMGIAIQKIISEDDLRKFTRGEINFDGKHEMNIESWPFGHITIGELNTKTVNYSLKYITKKSRVPQYKNDDRQKEKSIMSKGIGKAWVEREDIKKLYNNDPERQYAVTAEGKKIALPRYYRERLFDSLEREMIAKKLATEEFNKRLEMGNKELKLYELRKRKSNEPQPRATIQTSKTKL